jgi:hypothetical protein
MQNQKPMMIASGNAFKGRRNAFTQKKQESNQETPLFAPRPPNKERDARVEQIRNVARQTIEFGNKCDKEDLLVVRLFKGADEKILMPYSKVRALCKTLGDSSSELLFVPVLAKAGTPAMVITSGDLKTMGYYACAQCNYKLRYSDEVSEIGSGRRTMADNLRRAISSITEKEEDENQEDED